MELDSQCSKCGDPLYIEKEFLGQVRKLPVICKCKKEELEKDKEKEEKNITTLAGGGFESTVRLAKSSGDTWAPIFLENSKSIIAVIDNYIEKMNLFRKLIEENDKEGLKGLMEEANKIKRILH